MLNFPNVFTMLSSRFVVECVLKRLYRLTGLDPLICAQPQKQCMKVKGMDGLIEHLQIKPSEKTLIFTLVKQETRGECCMNSTTTYQGQNSITIPAVEVRVNRGE